LDAADVSEFSQRRRDVCSRHFEDDMTDVMLSGDVRLHAEAECLNVDQWMGFRNVETLLDAKLRIGPYFVCLPLSAC